MTNDQMTEVHVRNKSYYTSYTQSQDAVKCQMCKGNISFKV